MAGGGAGTARQAAATTLTQSSENFGYSAVRLRTDCQNFNLVSSILMNWYGCLVLRFSFCPCCVYGFLTPCFLFHSFVALGGGTGLSKFRNIPFQTHIEILTMTTNLPMAQHILNNSSHHSGKHQCDTGPITVNGRKSSQPV